MDEGNEDAASINNREQAIWSELRRSLAEGSFWADKIATLRDEPAERLKLALEHLPLPGAFTEAAVALRALIRAKRCRGKPAGEELAMLYWLGAIRSFMLDYAPRLKEPGYNVVQAMPSATLYGLEIDYSMLGYGQLELLKKTDRKWLVEQWASPEATRHLTLYTTALGCSREKADC